ncbi:MAG: IS21 family transposase, partial [Pseudomonadota bacterium]
FENGAEIARHPVIEGKNRRWIDPTHRKAPPIRAPKPKAPVGVQRRPLDFYEAVGQRLAGAAS